MPLDEVASPTKEAVLRVKSVMIREELTETWLMALIADHLRNKSFPSGILTSLDGSQVMETQAKEPTEEMSQTLDWDYCGDNTQMWPLLVVQMCIVTAKWKYPSLPIGPM